jgi:hypothetical protein
VPALPINIHKNRSNATAKQLDFLPMTQKIDFPWKKKARGCCSPCDQRTEPVGTG